MTSARDEHRAMAAGHAHDVGIADPKPHGIGRMDLGEGLGQMLRQARAFPVRVMVCQWSRTRPVLSTSGIARR